MSDLPKPETDDPREQDHGELLRPSARHLPTSPAKSTERKIIYGMLTAAAAITLAIFTMGR